MVTSHSTHIKIAHRIHLYSTTTDFFLLFLPYFFPVLYHLPEECLANPVHDLDRADDGEAAEESQGPADVGDHVDDGDGGGLDDLQGDGLGQVQADVAGVPRVGSPVCVRVCGWVCVCMSGIIKQAFF